MGITENMIVFLSIKGKQAEATAQEKQVHDDKTIKELNPYSFTNKMANRLKQDKHRNHCSQVILSSIHTTQKQFRRHSRTTYERLETDLLTVSHGAFFQLGCFLWVHYI